MRIGMVEVAKAGEAAARRSRFVEARNDALREIREKRQTDLKGRKSAIERATTLYSVLDADGEHPDVRLRSGFVWLAQKRPERVFTGDRKTTLEKDVETRPPCTALIFRQGNALQVYMTCIYVAHLENEPGAQVENDRPNSYGPSWVDLCGLKLSGDQPRGSNRRLGRALVKLEKRKLVSVGKAGDTGRFGGFRLLREDGSGHPYEVPAATSSAEVFDVPAGFFLAGWHLVLTGEELATFLAVLDQSNRRRPRPPDVGVGFSESTRWARYGLAAEAYSAHRELEEFGLIDVTDPEGRRNGKLKPGQKSGDGLSTYQMHYPPKVQMDFSKPAFEVVMDKLKASAIPPRLID